MEINKTIKTFDEYKIANRQLKKLAKTVQTKEIKQEIELIKLEMEKWEENFKKIVDQKLNKK